MLKAGKSTLDSPGAPLIGITTYSATAKWGVWDLPATLVPRAYVRSVVESGGAPVLLPALPASHEAAEALFAALIEPLQGLLLCGGPDIGASHYGAPPDHRASSADDERDAFELGLLAAARSRDLPLLGICRGAQLLNVSMGGSLDQHLASAAAHVGGAGIFAEHEVAIEPASRLASLIGTSASVQSYHHQGIERLGAGLRACARAGDGAIEGIEDPTGRFRIGVLWHPEMGSDRSLFRSLVEAAQTLEGPRE